MARLPLEKVAYDATHTSPMTRLNTMVAGEGFEPPKSKTADLQSDPFGRLGNLPGAHPPGFSSRSEARSSILPGRGGHANHLNRAPIRAASSGTAVGAPTQRTSSPSPAKPT